MGEISSPSPGLSSPSPGLSSLHSRLGVYRRNQSSTRNGFPVWSQDTGDCTLYRDCAGFWFLWPEDETDLSGLHVEEQGLAEVPLGASQWRIVQGRPSTVTVTGVTVLPGSCSPEESPCSLQSSCSPLWGGVTCTCKEGWLGETCDTDTTV